MRDAVAVPVLSIALLAGGADRAVCAAAPQRLAIYYGYPSLVNGAGGDLHRAAEIFRAYDIVILGDGLEFNAPGAGAGPAEHASTVALLRLLRQQPRAPRVFGYVDLGRTQQLPPGEIARRVTLWSRTGADGVFFDEAGYDFGVTRERQNAAVAVAHDLGLRVCLNAYRPDDLFSRDRVPLNDVGGGNPNGVAPLLGEGDAVLLESFAVVNGAPESTDQMTARLTAAADGRARYGTSIYAIATGLDSDGQSYAWWAAAALGVDAFGWASADYGAGASRLPWIPRPRDEAALRAARYLDRRPSFSPGRWRRRTSAGTIVIDPRARAGCLRPR